MTTPLKQKYVTGHCGNGSHEGTTVLSAKGARLTSCRGVYKYRYVEIKCGCFCHDMYAMMREQDPDALADMSEPTPPVTSADTVPLTPFDMLAGLPIMPGAAPTDEHKVYRKLLYSGAIGISSQLANMVHELVFGIPAEVPESTDGQARRRRGELEANVEVVCRLWLDKKIPWPELTTDIIGLMIDAEDTPSPGAIHAVLTRWAGANLAEIGHKPMRFLSFPAAVAEDGIASVRTYASREAERRARGFF